MSDEVIRFVELVRRDLGADEVRVEDEHATPDSDETRIVAPLPPGRRVVAVFRAPPIDVSALVERLAMLIRSFSESLSESLAASSSDDSVGTRSSRPPAGRALHDELSALAKRAGGLDAVVIDADSPVVWGTATGGDAPISPSGAVIHYLHKPKETELRPLADRDAAANDSLSDITRRAVAAVRALPAMSGLHKGRRMRHFELGGSLAYATHSFAGIYLLVVVFDGTFDELRAERAMSEALPGIERLVLALPPLDPTPEPRAGALSRKRPRR